MINNELTNLENLEDLEALQDEMIEAATAGLSEVLMDLLGDDNAA